MIVERLTPASYKVMPWRNGGGTTTEIWRLDDPDDADGFLLRLSIASIGMDGPFSLFPGIDRTFMLLDGGGVRLDFENGQSLTLEESLKPIRFSGDIKVESSLLNGPVRDFNLMAKRGIDAELGVQQVPAKSTRALPVTHATLVYVLEGKVEAGDGISGKGDTLIWPAGRKGDLKVLADSTLITVSARVAQVTHEV